jgi:TPR repeat protein
MISLFLIPLSSSFSRSFPFVPIVLPHPTSSDNQVRDFFDLLHLKNGHTGTRVIRTCVANLKDGKSTGKSLERLDSLVEAGNPDALFIVGTIHEFGLFGRPSNDTLARHLYSLGARSGHSECQANLAFMLRYGLGGPRDEAQASSLTTASRGKSVWSTLHASLEHHFGINAPESCHLAFRGLRSLAETVLLNTSMLRMLGNIGVTRLPHTGLPSNSRESRREVDRLQAARGDPRSHIALGISHLRSSPPEVDEARRHFTRALELDATIGDAYLFMYVCGLLTGRMELDPLRYAAERGNLRAQAELGRIYLASGDPAIRWRGRQLIDGSVAERSIDGIYWLAIGCLWGEFPYERNVSRAVELLHFCRRHGHFGSIYQLASLGYDRVESEWSCDKSLRALTLFFELSFLFDDASVAWGAVANRDLPFALRIYQRLADMGSEAAAWNAERLAGELRADPADWFEIGRAHV